MWIISPTSQGFHAWPSLHFTWPAVRKREVARSFKSPQKVRRPYRHKIDVTCGCTRKWFHNNLVGSRKFPSSYILHYAVATNNCYRSLSALAEWLSFIEVASSVYCVQTPPCVSRICRLAQLWWPSGVLLLCSVGFVFPSFTLSASFMVSIHCNWFPRRFLLVINSALSRNLRTGRRICRENSKGFKKISLFFFDLIYFDLICCTLKLVLVKFLFNRRRLFGGEFELGVDRFNRKPKLVYLVSAITALRQHSEPILSNSVSEELNRCFE